MLLCRLKQLSASKLACTHTLIAIIRSLYLKIRSNSENKASSKAERRGWEREKERGGGDGEKEGGHPTAGAWMKDEVRKGGAEGKEGNLCCIVMPQLPIWLFRHLFFLIGCSVSTPVDSAVFVFFPTTGLLLSERATAWQSWTHSGAHSSLGSAVTKKGLLMGFQQIWGGLNATISDHLGTVEMWGMFNCSAVISQIGGGCNME